MHTHDTDVQNNMIHDEADSVIQAGSNTGKRLYVERQSPLVSRCMCTWCFSDWIKRNDSSGSIFETREKRTRKNPKMIQLMQGGRARARLAGSQIHMLLFSLL